MSKGICRTLVVLLATVPMCAAQDVQDADKDLAAKKQAPPSAAADAKDLRSDLEIMRALLGQMQRNVAFVSAGDTPLKHQFELEMEMWQLLLRDAERKGNAQPALCSK